MDENGKLMTKNIHLTPNNLNVLLNLLDEKGLEVAPVDWSGINSDEEYLPFPSWSILHSFRVVRFKDVYGVEPLDKFKPRNYSVRKPTTTKGVQFFRWWLKDDVPKIIRKQLERYQILSRKSPKKLLKDSCFIYSLRQTGVAEEVLDQMKQCRLSADRFICIEGIRE